MSGEVLAGFALGQEVGSGGIGTVYLAEHPRLEQRAVVKVFEGAVSASLERMNLAFADARAATGLEHPGIVEVLECGEEDGRAFIVMEYVDGQSLAMARIAVGRFTDIKYVLLLAEKIANALGAAHRAGIVHGDLKPENILVLDAASEEPNVKLLDFGMVRLGAGTGAYASPEQRRSESTIGPASDIFSLGCIIYDLICGSPPFGPGKMESEGFAAPSSLVSTLPATFDEFMRSLLAENPQERLGSMKEVEARCSELRRVSNPAVRTAVLSDPRAASDANEVTAPSATVAATQAYQVQKKARRVAPSSLSSGVVVAKVSTPKREDPVREVVRGPSVAAAARNELRAEADAAGAPRWPRFVLVAAGVVMVAAVLVGILWVPDQNAHDSATPAPAPAPLKVEAEGAQRRPMPLEMVVLSGGTFTMGSTEAEIDAALERCKTAEPSCRRDRFQREGPARSIALEPFLLDRTEVTNEQFVGWLSRQVVEVDRGRLVRASGVLFADLQPARGGIEVGASGRLLARAGQGQKPVVQVTWYAAQQFCKDGGKRLPTEAEWEYAARGLEGRRFPWGDREPACTEVDFGHGPNGACGAAGGPDDVGSASGDVTPDGVRDLGGSVAEWVADMYVAPYPACDGECRGPLQGGGEQGSGPRVIRGGDWNEPLDSARSAGRTRSDPGRPWSNVGFRCAKGTK